MCCFDYNFRETTHDATPPKKIKMKKSLKNVITYHGIRLALTQEHRIPDISCIQTSAQSRDPLW